MSNSAQINIWEILKVPEPSTEENKILFDVALTHKSVLTYPDESDLTKHYDRLEFLGDAVLKTIINSHIFELYPKYHSGDLTTICSYLLSDKVLTFIANDLKLAPYIKHGKRVRKESLLGDIMESLFGAIYLIYGYNTLQPIILDLYKNYIPEAHTKSLEQNYKATLQEYLQRRGKELPEYIIVTQRGPVHDPTFKIAIYINNQHIAEAEGTTKKEASQKAAKLALASLKKEKKKKKNKTD